jgi:DNA-binding NarL/FixJ family response regulator
LFQVRGDFSPTETRIAFFECGTLFACCRPVADSDPAYVVVTFSPQPSIAYFLKGVLDCAGFTVIAASSTPDDLAAVVERTRPNTIVYDVSYPFTESWNQLRRLQSRAAVGGIPFVVTTSDARELRRQVGVATAIEICTRPDDVFDLREAVQCAIEATGRVRFASLAVEAS